MTHICELSPSGEPAESARDLLERHGLPEDVVDGALCLHAQELAAVQRREAAVWGVDTAAGKHILGAADLIDPTRTAPAAVPVPPPADQTALRDRIRRVLCVRDGQGALWGTDMLEPDEYGADADAVMAVLPEQTDRAAVLRWAADELGRMDYDTDNTDYGYDTYRDAWNGGVMDAAALLRRVAAEEQPAETPMFGSPDCTCIPFTRQGGKPRYCGPTDTVDMISGWEIGRDCPHHKTAVGEQPETQEAPRG